MTKAVHLDRPPAGDDVSLERGGILCAGHAKGMVGGMIRKGPNDERPPIDKINLYILGQFFNGVPKCRGLPPSLIRSMLPRIRLASKAAA